MLVILINLINLYQQTFIVIIVAKLYLADYDKIKLNHRHTFLTFTTIHRHKFFGIDFLTYDEVNIFGQFFLLLEDWHKMECTFGVF